LHPVVERRIRQAEPPERSPDESDVTIVNFAKIHPGRRRSWCPLMMMKGSRAVAPSPNRRAKLETGPPLEQIRPVARERARGPSRYVELLGLGRDQERARNTQSDPAR